MLSDIVKDPDLGRGLIFRSVQNKPLIIFSLKTTVFYTLTLWRRKSYLA